jgi:hypothetical protein
LDEDSGVVVVRVAGGDAGVRDGRLGVVVDSGVVVGVGIAAKLEEGLKIQYSPNRPGFESRLYVCFFEKSTFVELLCTIDFKCMLYVRSGTLVRFWQNKIRLVGVATSETRGSEFESRH